MHSPLIFVKFIHCISTSKCVFDSQPSFDTSFGSQKWVWLVGWKKSFSFPLHSCYYPLCRYLYADLKRLAVNQSGLLWRGWERTSRPINWTILSKKGKPFLFFFTPQHLRAYVSLNDFLCIILRYQPANGQTWVVLFIFVAGIPPLSMLSVILMMPSACASYSLPSPGQENVMFRPSSSADASLWSGWTSSLHLVRSERCQ